MKLKQAELVNAVHIPTRAMTKTLRSKEAGKDDLNIAFVDGGLIEVRTTAKKLLCVIPRENVACFIPAEEEPTPPKK